MTRFIVLDAGPLGLVTQRDHVPVADACRRLLRSRVLSGVRLIVPEIVDYELRRELVRLGVGPAVAKLDRFIAEQSDRYLPLTTAAMRRAAELWAEVRNRGRPTADPKELDGDVILAAQVLTSGLPIHDTVVATTNVGHLSQFVPAQDWQAI